MGFLQKSIFMNSMNAFVPLFLYLLLSQCFAHNDKSIVNIKARKRSLANPSDPRELFAALYRYRKGLDLQKKQDVGPYFRPLFEKKSGIQDPLDPRNLFRAIYGYKK